MKSANEILKIREERRQEKIKLEAEQINKEMLEVEKSLNTYEKNIEDTKPYVDIAIIIKSQVVKDLLKEKGFYIDKVNQDIPYGVTRVYLDKISFDIATKRSGYNRYSNITNNDITKVNEINEDEKVTKDTYCNNEENNNLNELLAKLAFLHYANNRNKSIRL